MHIRSSGKVEFYKNKERKKKFSILNCTGEKKCILCVLSLDRLFVTSLLNAGRIFCYLFLISVFKAYHVILNSSCLFFNISLWIVFAYWQVRLIDNFTNKKGMTSHCYRIAYRSMERSLTDDEINELQVKTLHRTGGF